MGDCRDLCTDEDAAVPLSSMPLRFLSRAISLCLQEIWENLCCKSQFLSRHLPFNGWLGSRVHGQRAGLRNSRAWVQIAAATLSGNSLGQTVHTHRASVHQAAKLVAALLRVAGVTAGLAESNGSLPPGL